MSERAGNIIFKIIIPVVLVVALVAVAVWGHNESARADEMQNVAVQMYSRAFGELADNFSNLETVLGKLTVAGSPTRYILLLDDVWRISGTATSLMSQLPESHAESKSMNEFAVRAGDYAHALTKRILGGEVLNEDEKQQLLAMKNTCSAINEKLRQRMSDNKIPIERLTSDGYYNESEEYKSEENKTAYPTLIYDGPFSESSEKVEARGIAKLQPVNMEAAMEEAKKAAGEDFEIKFECEVKGKMPTYDFSGDSQDGRHMDISVTKAGGKLVTMMTTAVGDKHKISEKEAAELKEVAQEYMKALGFENMKSTYAQYYDGATVINFAATQDGVILYSDLVKVWIDVEAKKVIGLDARNYWFSHIERELSEPEITVTEAQSMLNGNLKVESRELALIPLTPQTEVLCYEFKGRNGEETYIVYINASTGEEEEIYRIINSDDGQLVI